MPRFEAALLALAQVAVAAYYEEVSERYGAADMRAPAAADSCHGQVGFVHIPKCGGTGILSSLDSCCNSRLLKKAKRVTRPRREWHFFWFHSTALEQRTVVGPEVWDRAYTFALVRNPWDRQLSRFFFRAGKVCVGEKLKQRFCQEHRFHAGKQELGPQDFQQWVRILHKSYPLGSPKERFWSVNPRLNINADSGYHGAAQWYWITDPSGKLLVKGVIKLEELEQHWPRLQSSICGLQAVSYAQHSAHGRGLCAGSNGCPEGAGSSVKQPKRRQDYYDNETRDIVAEHMQLDIDNLNYTFYD
eukprot:TRINITY_DN6116_c0_g1_i2.p1 TRINITY_DN6116_c0_g1~~TRINITY_DN6116_c0_g1_i2.p1  ORF type:complete len:302 (+),score=92.09 TRINITY_DN6116_c0_g1_i2:81-986(+)